jgi:COP9 signalosome complex subunit 7
MSSLDITTTRDLEDLCINTIYASLLTGKLSPHTQTFQITSCTSRDLSPTHTDYPGMISTLTQWSSQCDLVLAEIVGRIRDVRNSATARKNADDEFEKDLEAAKKSTQQGAGKKGKSSKSTLSGGGGGPGTGTMSQQGLDDVNSEFMQDVEEQQQQELMSPGRAAGSIGAGGESPSGRKRKLVRTPDYLCLS